MAPITINAQDIQHTPIESEATNQVSVVATDFNLRVKNADGLVLEVFSLTGQKVYSQKIEGSSKSIDLSQLTRGYYIVRINKYTRKVYLH